MVEECCRCVRVIGTLRDLEEMMQESFFTVWKPVKFLDALPVVLDHFWDGVCHYVRGHGAIERKGKSFEMNMWLVLVRSVEWKVFESFEVRVRGVL